jgi:SAM-dependent methyltransferase
MAKIKVDVVKSKRVLSNYDYLRKWGGSNNYDIGCGPIKLDGYIGIDLKELPGVDIIHDLNNIPWPIQRNSADLVIASHVIEHVDNAIEFMEEIHAILKPGGKAVIKYPHFSQRCAFQDPTHKRFMTVESLDYFIIGSESFGIYSNFEFKNVSKILNINNDIGFLIGKLDSDAYEKFFCHIFPAWQVIQELEKL